MDSDEFVRLASALLAVGLLIDGAERLFIAVQDEPDLFPWRILRERWPIRKWGWVRSVVLDRIFSSRGRVFQSCMQIFASLGALFTWSLGDFAGGSAFTVLVCILLLEALRNPFGREGADQLAVLLVIAVALFYLSGSDYIAPLVLSFGCAMTVLAYFCGGLAKLRGSKWRRGVALSAAWSSAFFGLPPLGAFLRERPVLDHILSWGVLVGEVAFVAVYWLPVDLLLPFLLLVAALHLMLAIIMGLNLFVWIFGAGLVLVYGNMVS